MNKFNHPLQQLALLTAALVMTARVGSAIPKAPMLAPSASTAALPKVTISIGDIHRQVDVKSLPMQEVRDPF